MYFNLLLGMITEKEMGGGSPLSLWAFGHQLEKGKRQMVTESFGGP